VSKQTTIQFGVFRKGARRTTLFYTTDHLDQAREERDFMAVQGDTDYVIKSREVSYGEWRDV
jgi:hypothetical protein